MTDDRQTRDRELAELLQYLHETRGLDLSGYKRVGLIRRLTKRMRTVGVEGFGAYQFFIEAHPGMHMRDTHAHKWRDFKMYRTKLIGCAGSWFILDVVYYANVS